MKKIFMALAALYALGSQAQEHALQWAMKEPKSGKTVLMSNVSFLLASDWQSTFSIVCKDGTVVADAETVDFVKTEPTGINSTPAAANEPQPALCAAGRLTLTGCKGGERICIYDAAGREAASANANAGQTDIDISRLAAGVYVLRAGETAVKFIKK